MKYGYVITTGEEVHFNTPFKRISSESVKMSDCIHSITKFDNGLIFEGNVYDGRIENYTNMQLLS